MNDRKQTKFRPCIDLHDGKVKQIVGGTLEGSLVTNFESNKDPAWYADLYKKSGLLGGHVIKLGPGNDDAAKACLQAYPGGLQIGGGINPTNAQGWLDAGASHVIVTSCIFTGPVLDMDKLAAMKEAVGKDRLVLDLSCRRVGSSWHVATDRWKTVTDTEVNRECLQELAGYCAEFLVHSADVEGLQQGIDAELVSFLAAHSPIPVTYAGGARGLSDLQKVQELSGGAVDVTIGSALDIFGGSGVTFDECVAFNKGD